MEYEQVEYGRKIVLEAITRQNVNAYHDLLSPEVLLVTHFPYPTSSTDSNVQAIQQWVQLSQTRTSGNTASTAAGSSKQRARELLMEQEKQRERQQKRYEAFRKRREGHQVSAAGDEAGGDGEAAAGDGKKHSTGDAATIADGGASGGGGGAQADGARRAFSKFAESLEAKATGAKNRKAPASDRARTERVPLGVRWFRQQQQQQQQQQEQGGGYGSAAFHHQQPRSPTVPGQVSATPAQTSIAAAAAAAVQHDAPEDSSLAYEDVVDIAEGRLLVSFRLFELLHWISSGKGTAHIAPVEVELQLRKDILQEDEVLSLPPPPTTVYEQYDQLGSQHTERNQPLSCITVIWGRDYLLFKDKIFFDDGLIVTIQRTMLTVPEVVVRAGPPSSSSPRKQPQQQHQQQQQNAQSRLSDRRHRAGGLFSAGSGKGQSQVASQAEMAYRAVEAFYGVSASRVNTTNTSWALLDYSFLDATEPSALLRLAPASGCVHVGKLPRAAADPRLAQGVFLNQDNDPSMAAAGATSRTLIKAKNKRGEEEAYEFNDNRHRFSVLQNEGGGGGGSGNGEAAEGEEWGLGNDAAHGAGSGKAKGRGAAGGGVASVRAQRYDASCVRVSGCHLHFQMDQLVPVLRRLVANSLLTLHTLDLSQNDIATLPDLRLLPLQNLKLHDNAIADWRVVEQQIAPLPYLTVLTLHGNPIAEERDVPRSATTTAAAVVAAKHSRSRGGAAGGAAASANATGESSYWKKLLALLLSHPARVAQLRQVDFVTLTAQDLNVAGAHALFTTGKSEVLDRVRAMNATSSRKAASTKAVSTVRAASRGGAK